MKVAVIGPICKDVTYVDEKKLVGMGSIPYYTGNALKALDVDVTGFITHNLEDNLWVEENFSGIKVNHVSADSTLNIVSRYSAKNPDTRVFSVENYSANKITIDDVGNLSDFDWISLGPLFVDNMDEEFFKALPKGKLIFNNFGMFNHFKDGKRFFKDPEALIKVLKYFEFLVLDDKELMFVSGRNSIEESIKYLRSKGLKNAAITKGSNGSTIFVDDKIFNIPAFKPKTFVDATGSGDTYVAGLIKGMELFGDDFNKIGKFAAMLCTLKIENHGPFSKSLKDVLKRLDYEK